LKPAIALMLAGQAPAAPCAGGVLSGFWGRGVAE
jgi:hypothetical protein